MSTNFRLTVVAIALLAIAGCHGSHGYKLTLGPYLSLDDSGPTFVAISWAADFDGFWADPAPVLLELWRWDEDDYKFRKLVELAPDTTTYRDEDLDEDLDYEYRLYAFFDKGPKRDSVTLEAPASMRAAAPAKLASTTGPGEVPWLGLLPGEPRLSPDGTRLVTVEEGRLLLFEVATGHTSFPAFEARGPVSGAAFLPDGERLLVSAGPAGREDLYLATLAGAEIRPVTTGGAGDREPDVAPDGVRVVFVRDGILHALELGPDEARPLGFGPATEPRWSPRGEELAFLRPGPDGFELSASGRPLVPLTAGASGSGPLVWSPDGRSVYYRAADGTVRPAPVAR
ncbi:MAG: hypothetical protein MUE73_07320 [Planctomycetes bacterium]|jgi:hypothetical protein|nr:hypothetical protein [Planctomycetota bacterium]